MWAARFFKTRELAARACELGRVEVNTQRAKPSRAVRPGDRLSVKNEGGTFEIDLLLLSEVRGPATVAQTLYRETEESRHRREREAAELRTLGSFAGEGRPSRHERQVLGRLRGNP